jgi:hypothetical protein
VRDTRLLAVDLKGALVGTSVAGSAKAASAWTAGVEAAQPRRPRRRRERLVGPSIFLVASLVKSSGFRDPVAGAAIRQFSTGAG